MHALSLTVASHTQQTEKVCSVYLLKNNQVQQFVKILISSMSRMHTLNLPRPECNYHYSPNLLLT